MIDISGNATRLAKLDYVNQQCVPFEVSKLASSPEAMYKLAARSKSSNQTALGDFFSKKKLVVIYLVTAIEIPSYCLDCLSN